MSRVTAPGYSIDLSDAVIIASRRVRGLGRVVPIDFSINEEKENELAKWHRERWNQLIWAIQLRREREGPYFHQFIVFELQDNGGLYRIDRRLRPNEDAPLNSLKDEGIPAFDTIEPVVSWDDPLFVASDCLIAVEFKVDVSLLLLIQICHRIHSHPRANVYTLQRYNCYFFAQTLLVCVVCGASDWCGTKYLSSSVYKNAAGYLSPITPVTTINTLVNSDLLSDVVGSVREWRNLEWQEWREWREWLKHLKRRERRGWQGWRESAQELGWRECRTKVEWLQLKLRNNPLWGEGREWHAMVEMAEMGGRRALREIRGSDTTRIMGAPRSEEVHRLQIALRRYWDRERAAIREKLVSRLNRKIMHSGLWNIKITNFDSTRPDIAQIESESRGHWATFLESWAFRGYAPSLDIPMYGRSAVPSFTTGFWGISDALDHQINQQFDKVWNVLLTEVSDNLRAADQAVQTRLRSFEQNMTIRINHMKMPATLEETGVTNYNPGNIPRYTMPQSTATWQRKKTGKKDTAIMVESTISEMQQHLTGLINAHSTRVEEYKWMTKADAHQVAHDIHKAMDEVWAALIE